MLLRNMNGKQGLANGTILICREFKTRVIKCTIADGNRQYINTVVLLRSW